MHVTPTSKHCSRVTELLDVDWHASETPLTTNQQPFRYRAITNNRFVHLLFEKFAVTNVEFWIRDNTFCNKHVLDKSFRQWAIKIMYLNKL